MVISVKKFEDLVNDNDLEDYVKKVEYDVDNAIKKYATLDEADRAAYTAVFMPEYDFNDEPNEICWYTKNYHTGQQHLGRLLRELSAEERIKVRQRVVDDYNTAGWNVSWDLEDVGQNKQAFILVIELPTDDDESENDWENGNEPEVFD